MEAGELTHPGFIDYEADNFEDSRKTRAFDQFEPFISTAGLDEATAKSFLQFLQEYFQETKNNWEPSKCTTIPGTSEVAAGFTTSIFGENAIITPKRFLRSHFWLQLQLPDAEKVIIIDPTGIPNNISEHDRRKILPYFGPLESAPEASRKIYTKAENMDDWGTRSLPSGFRP